MLRGLYTATSGMIAQQRKHDALTNNIANAQTPGYKQDVTAFRAFPEMLITRIRDGVALPGAPAQASPIGQAAPVGRLNTGMFAEEQIPLFRQGDLQPTSLPLDVALVDASGEAATFFAVRTAEGAERYTRDGRFALDALGQLVTAQGNLVLNGDGSPIQLGDAAQVQFLRDGTILATVDGVQEERARLRLVSAGDPQGMVREGHGAFRWDGDAAQLQAPAAGAAEVRQGYLERSNVDPVETNVQLISAARAYEANQKIIQFYDKSLDKTVNEIGRV